MEDVDELPLFASDGPEDEDEAESLEVGELSWLLEELSVAAGLLSLLEELSLLADSTGGLGRP